MRFLLDTHALLWWWLGDDALASDARDAIIDAQNDVFVSAATGWEIATKVRKGQLPEMLSRMPNFLDNLVSDRFRHLDVRVDHGLLGGALSGEHKDPFDRLLAAQALIENLTVVTRDPAFAAFGCKVLW